MIKTVSLETAKLLKENGFRQDTHFFWANPHNKYSLWTKTDVYSWGYEHTIQDWIDESNPVLYAAPTTDELLEKLPPDLMIREAFNLRYEVGHVNINDGKLFGHEYLPEALAQMWLYHKKEGLLCP